MECEKVMGYLFVGGRDSRVKKVEEEREKADVLQALAEVEAGNCSEMNETKRGRKNSRLVVEGGGRILIESDLI